MKHVVLTERELESIFSGKKRKEKHKKVFNFFKPIISFVAITCILFVAFNFIELKANFLFWYDTNFNYSKADENKLDYGQQVLQSLLKSQNKGNGATNGSSTAGTGAPASSGSTNTSGAGTSGTGANGAAAAPTNLPPLPELADSHLRLPAINVDAPITWKVNNDPDSVLENLKNGLIQIDGTALPGQKGNVFITGHSSNYPWIKSKYNNVFALLNKVVVGDVVHIKYGGQDYLYRVSEIKVTKPDDLSVMQPTSSPVLTLMTCTPVGTSLKRLIVTAKQYYPDPSLNKTSGPVKSDMKMPKTIR